MNKKSLVALYVSYCATVLLVFTVPLFGQPPGKGQQPGPKRESATKQEVTTKQEVMKKPENKPADSAAPPAFRIDQPGTITFTMGMVIKGKIEKPQVIIFLPKEKPYYRDLNFTRSFADEISDPLPFTPIIE